MKTATLPSLRVDPELRAAAEGVLEKGETLSAFVEHAVKAQVHYRKTQAEFIARGLASLEEAEKTGIYYGSDDVLDILKAKIDLAKALKKGMTYTIRYTKEALEDFNRLYDYLIVFDIALADRAYEALQQAITLLEIFPFSCRKASPDNALLRELVVPFGASGYIVLFRIDSDMIVTVAAVRQQREDDYH